MNTFKNKIQSLNEPLIHQKRSFITVAKILDTNEKNNSCSIQYIDNEGLHSNKKGVTVKISDPKLPSYFPKKGDFVVLEVYENTLLITGPHFNYENTERGAIYQTTNNTLYFKDYGALEGSIL